MVVAHSFEGIVQGGSVCHGLGAAEKAVLYGEAHQVGESFICAAAVESEVSTMQLCECFLHQTYPKKMWIGTPSEVW